LTFGNGVVNYSIIL